MASKQNTSKNRKSEAQKSFEEADNAGRFTGNDSDAKAAREQAVENIRQDTNASTIERNKQKDNPGEITGRPIGQSYGIQDEADNINRDVAQTINEDELKHSTNKANEGSR